MPGIDIVCGGFPCQDLSIAGQKKGIEGERSGLWSELCRVISEVRPRYAIVENVPNLLVGPIEKRGGWMGRVLGDLAEIGYDAEWHCIPASFFGASHVRDRVWIIAYPNSLGRNRVAEGGEERLPILNPQSLGHIFECVCHVGDLPSFLLRNVDGFFASPSCGIKRNDDGLSEGMDRLKAVGNAVYPRIVEFIGKSIMWQEREIACR